MSALMASVPAPAHQPPRQTNHTLAVNRISELQWWPKLETKMQKQRFSRSGGPMDAEDLFKLQTLANHVCNEIGANRNSLKAALIMDTLVAVYKAGVRDERLLLACVSKRMPSKRKRDSE